MTPARDYSLTGPENRRAVERGLAGAAWYRPAVAPDRMRDLTRRSDGRAAADTLLWLSLLVVAGVLAHRAFGTWWAVPAFALYGTLYGSACDARWHECGHATAFRARWPRWSRNCQALQPDNLRFQLGDSCDKRHVVAVAGLRRDGCERLLRASDGLGGPDLRLVTVSALTAWHLIRR